MSIDLNLTVRVDDADAEKFAEEVAAAATNGEGIAISTAGVPRFVVDVLAPPLGVAALSGVDAASWLADFDAAVADYQFAVDVAEHDVNDADQGAYDDAMASLARRAADLLRPSAPQAEDDNPMAGEDPANAPVLAVGVFEYPSDYSDNSPEVVVATTAAHAWDRLAVEVAAFIRGQIGTEPDPHSDEADLRDFVAEHGDEPQTGKGQEWLDALRNETNLGGAWQVTTEPVWGAGAEPTDDADDEGPTYHGIVRAKCLTCGYESRKKTELELWNDYGVACIDNPDHKGASEWELTDGTVSVVPAEGDSPAEVQNPSPGA